MRKRKSHNYDLDLPADLRLQQIVNQRVAANVRSVSVATLRREIERTGWPPVIHISDRRVGHRLCDVLREKPADDLRR